MDSAPEAWGVVAIGALRFGNIEAAAKMLARTRFGYDRHTRRDQLKKDIWLRPLRKDWRRTLNR